MLKDRILSTLKFFDLQDCPLTLLELHKFLLPEPGVLENVLDERGELKPDAGFPSPQINPVRELTAALDRRQLGNNFPLPPTLSMTFSNGVNISEVQASLESHFTNEIICRFGYYALAGRESIILGRWQNYCYGIKREQLIARFLPGVRHLPFLRGVSVLGSQALGMPREGSDIDLLILVDGNRIGLARVFVTCYFQVLGLRRHGKKIANRFCLNHYVAANKVLNSDRNLYTASEYLKMRPALGNRLVANFQYNNRAWMGLLFSNAAAILPIEERSSSVRLFLERILSGRFGRFLERWVKKAQYNHINRGEFIVVSEDELSFHPNNRKQQLFNNFFSYIKQQRPQPPSLVSEI